jgi:hypothetical protein
VDYLFSISDLANKTLLLTCKGHGTGLGGQDYVYELIFESLDGAASSSYRHS